MNTASLNINELGYSDRLDWNFYDPKYIDMLNTLETFECKLLSQIVSEVVKTGSTPPEDERIPLDDNSDVLFIKTDSVRKGYIDYNVADWLPLEAHEKKPLTALKYNDVIVTAVGATKEIIGRSGVYLKTEPANINQSDALIRLKNPKYAGYVSTFINSKYGRSQLWKYSSQTGQVTLNAREIEQMIVPLLPTNIINNMHEYVSKSEKFRIKAYEQHENAKSILNSKIYFGKKNNQPTKTFDISFKKVNNSEVLNPYYFDPIHDKLDDVISSYSNGYAKLIDMVKFEKGIEVGSAEYTDNGNDFIRIRDFSIFGINGSDKKISKEIFDKYKKKYNPKIGDILFSKDGSVGITYVLKEKINGLISNGFLRLTLKPKYNNFNKECLAYILNSDLINIQIKRLVTGSIILHLKSGEFSKIKIPLIRSDVQKKIGNLSIESHKNLQQSKKLLNDAKIKLETYIEKQHP